MKAPSNNEFLGPLIIELKIIGLNCLKFLNIKKILLPETVIVIS
jgi:hypothetical protein